MTDLAKKPFGNVLDQPVDENQHGEGREAPCPSPVIVLEPEGNAPALEPHDAPLGDCGALGVAAGIFDRPLGAAKRRAYEDMPPLLADMPQQLADIEAAPAVAPEPAKVQGLCLMGPANPLNYVELPLRSEKRSGDKVPSGSRYPALAVETKPSGGDDDMKVRIPLKIASEGMKHDDDAGKIRFPLPASLHPPPATFPLGHGPSGRQAHDRPRRGLEKNIEQHPPVVLDEEAKLPGYREDKMPVAGVEHVREQLAAPLVRADLPAAGAEHGLAAVRHHHRRVAFRTQEKMRPQPGRSAREHSLYVVPDGFTHPSSLRGNVAHEVVGRLEDLGYRNGSPPHADYGTPASTGLASPEASISPHGFGRTPKPVFYGRRPSARSA